MYYDFTKILKMLYITLTVIVIGTISIVKIGVIDMHAIMATAGVLIPAVIVMGLLGQKIGEILDNPRNQADADYKLAVLNALKKMDKSITLEELNEKLTKQAEETDLPDSIDEV